MTFDSTELEAIFNALIEDYITILEDIYTGATASVHVDNQVSEKNTNTERREAGKPNFPQIIHSNNLGGL